MAFAMFDEPQTNGWVRFGRFEARLSTGELLQDGRVVRLQDQPFQVLRVLVEHPNELVTREQFRERIWGEDTYVDFDRSLNTAVARLREALGDSAQRRVYIETIPRKGYRFICPLNADGDAASPPPSTTTSETDDVKRRYRSAALGVAVFAVALLAWWIWPDLPPVERSEPALVATPLTHYRGIENEASFSPDGSQIAFTWNGDGQDNFDVYVRTIDGQRLLRLTTEPEREFSPAWSPDGQWIAYGRDLGDGRAAVLRRSPLGGHEERLLEVAWNPISLGSLVASSRLLAWSPDSRNLVVSDHAAGDDASLYLLDLEKGERQKLTNPPAPFSDSDPAFSPDGKFLAFRRSTNNVFVGYVMPLDAELKARGAPKRVTPRGAFIAPVWTPAGDRLLFSGPLPRPGIWTVDPTNAAAPMKSVPITGIRSIMPAIRRDGGLVVTHAAGEMNIWRLDLRAAVGQKSAHELIGSTTSDLLPHYSPDGRKIVFISARSGGGNWIADADGANLARLSDGGIARWSPDGTQIVCDKSSSAANRQGDLWLIDAAAGPQTQLTKSDANDRVPNWSRDGKWLYFASDRSGRDQIWKMPMEGGESKAVQLTRDGGFFATESVDGEMLFYTKFEEPGLWRMRLDDGVEESFIDAPIDFADYAVAQDGIYYATRGSSSNGGAIYFHRFDDATTSEVFRQAKRFGIGLDVSPDGRYVLYTQFDREESDLMLVSGFR